MDMDKLHGHAAHGDHHPAKAKKHTSGIGKRLMSHMHGGGPPHHAPSRSSSTELSSGPSGSPMSLNTGTDESPRRRMMAPVSPDEFGPEAAGQQAASPEGDYLHPGHPMVQDHADRISAIEQHLGIGKKPMASASSEPGEGY